MESYIEANKREISNLLNNVDKQLFIPNYQRDFVWKDKNGEEFFNDLLAQEDTKLFLGTFVFKQEAGNKEIEIVDGQQRITTILIFLIACKIFVKNKGFSEGLANQIQTYITFGFHKDTKRPRLKTKPEDIITQPFEIMCDPDWDGRWQEAMKDEKGWKQIQKTYNFFINRLKVESYDEEGIENLFIKIINIEYIEVIVKGAREAIETFERVNARGTPLKVYELVRAYLFSQRLDNQDFIKDSWQKIQDYEKLGSWNLNDVLFYFYFSQKGYIAKNNLYRELKVFADEDTDQFVQQLESFVQFCSIVLPEKKGIDESGLINYCNNRDNFDLGNKVILTEDNIKRIIRALFAIQLSNVKPIYSLIFTSLLSLLTQKHENAKNATEHWISFLEFVEDFYFVITIILRRTSNYGGALQNIYTRFCMSLNKEQNDFVDTILSAQLDFKKVATVDRLVFEASFLELNYVNNIGTIHYIFDRLNNTIKGTRERVQPTEYLSTVSMQNYTLRSNSVEHILPQSGNYREDLESAKHNIGNLLIIHRNHNSSLSNKPPDEKVKILQKWLDNGEIQNRQYIQEFIDYYNEIKEQGKEWDEKAIEERGRRLAQRMYEITYYKEKK